MNHATSLPSVTTHKRPSLSSSLRAATSHSLHSNSQSSQSRHSLPNGSSIQKGRLGNLTKDQEDTLIELKRQLTALNLYDENTWDDHRLLRFLRARKFHLGNTLLMIQKCSKWRDEFQVEEIYKSFVYTERDKVAAFYPRYYHKTDREGRPIYIEHYANVNYNNMFKVTTEKRFLQNHVLEVEKFLRQRLVAVSWKAGRHIEQSCTILDMKGIALTQFPNVRSVVGIISEISQDYYPETLGKMWIVNAPRLFTGVWSIVKMFLDEATVSKIHILGSDYKETLLENVAPENLPEELGGTCKCQGGCRNGDMGVWKDMSEEDWTAARAFAKAELNQYVQTPISPTNGITNGLANVTVNGTH